MKAKVYETLLSHTKNQQSPLICFYSGNKFTVEELFAMVLENAKQTAEAFAGK